MARDAGPARLGAARPAYGPDNFLLGANLPWISYGNDFGASAWNPDGGIGRPGQREQVEKTLDMLARDGVKNVRWWLFGDGRAGIRWGADGTPLGLDDKIFRDMDAAVAAARKSGVKLTFVLIDFLFAKGDRKKPGEVQTGGHVDVLKDPRKRKALIDNVFTPLFERYGRDPAIEQWDLINEPDWVTFAAGNWNPFSGVWRNQMRDYLREAAAAVHRHTDQWATVGLATTHNLGLARGLALDLYQAHWYDGHEWTGARLEKPVKTFGLDRPLILGEFPSKGSRREPQAILDAARKAGFGGAMLWSVHSSDPHAGYTSARGAVASWARDHAPVIAR